jgi:hypothetical protein
LHLRQLCVAEDEVLQRETKERVGLVPQSHQRSPPLWALRVKEIQEIIVAACFEIGEFDPEVVVLDAASRVSRWDQVLLDLVPPVCHSLERRSPAP